VRSRIRFCGGCENVARNASEISQNLFFSALTPFLNSRAKADYGSWETTFALDE
jgi:hypothetical protein